MRFPSTRTKLRKDGISTSLIIWLLSRYLLIWSPSDCPEDHRLRCDLLSQGLQSPAPAEIVRQVFRGDAMEATQPFLQSAVVGIDVVEVKIRCFGVRFAGHRQDVCRDPSAPDFH